MARVLGGTTRSSVWRHAEVVGVRCTAGKAFASNFVFRKALESALDSVEKNTQAQGGLQYIDTATVKIEHVPVDISSYIPASTATTVDLSAFPRADSVDPFSLVGPEMNALTTSIKQILGVDHPVLSTVAKYFFEHDGGKKIRPAIVLLMSHAVNAASPAASEGVYASQARLAEITEMIHTASLLHDDVIDMADTRRGVSSVNTVFGNKLAVLAGDFLLARSSVALARLRNVEVVEVLSTVIEHLVKGEVMQMRTALRNAGATDAAFDLYMRKTYYKTASLMANSCKAAVMLAGLDEDVVDAAEGYGRHIGLAFQLVDDILDFEGTTESLGKPALNDLTQGIATAPVLYATEDFPNLFTLIERKFQAPGDVDQACSLVEEASGVERTKQLAVDHAQKALACLEMFPDSPHRDGLAALVSRVIERTH